MTMNIERIKNLLKSVAPKPLLVYGKDTPGTFYPVSESLRDEYIVEVDFGLKTCGWWHGFREVPPFPKVDLTVGARIRLDWQRRLWDVIAVTDHFAILSRQAAFKKKGVLFYTIIDWRNGVYGTANVIGQGWDVQDPERLADLVDGLEKGDWEVSHRNRIEIQSIEVIK